MVLTENPEKLGRRILCLDGGGTSMLSEITIIDELMSRIQKKLGLSTKPRPCECFDLIGGTGTGGLLAILFGRLGMTMDEVTRACVDIVERTSGKRLSLSDTLFSASELENIMGEIVLKHTGRSDTAMIDESTRNSCKVMVCAMYADAIRPGFTPAIRSYKVPKNQGPECTIVEAVRATTATPGIFKPKVIMEHGIKITYMDAGLGCNNPSERLLPETDLVFPGDSVATIISVGAGQQHTISIPSPSPFVPAFKNNSFAAVKAIATDCEDINQRVSERFRGTKNVFFRFNAEQGMQDIDRADATRLAEIRVHTRNYMGHVSVSGLLDEAANSVTNRKGTVKVCDGNVIPVTESRPGIVHCPPPSLSFVGRESTLKQIEKCIFDGSGHRHVFVLYGLGGAGKTQIALSFVDRFKDRFWETFFVDATSLETIASCLEGIAEIAGEGKNANDVLKWLSSQNKRWLMVFDNADDPKINLGDYFPKSTTGDILITTKNNQMLVYAKGKEPHTRVQEMEHGEAKRLLLEKAELEDTEDVNVDVKTLLQLLGHLALAIVQAGAYIRVKRYGLKRYLELFRSYHLDLLEDPQIGQTGDCERSVYMTWRMNFSQLSPSAQTLLQIAAFMHHSDISEDIFRRAYAGAASFEPILNLSNDQKTAKEYIVDFLSRFQALDRTWDTLKFSVVISELESYSLTSLDQFNRNYNIHPLVHLWARSTCANPSVLAASTIWLIALAVTKGDASIDYAFRRTLVPHMSAVPSTQVLCFDVASSFARVYHETGQFMLAEKLQKQVLETSRRLLGMTHLYTLGMLSNLAVTYQAQHRWEDALKLQTEELQARKCIQNHKHPSMLTCMHNMASSYRNMGHLEDAERMRLEVLKARAETLGEDDPDTLCTMHNLATLYRKQGRYPEAEKLGLEVVAGCRRVLKCDHPKTLMAMNSLATIYQTQKKWLQAEELRKDAFNISKRVLGRDDPKTILSMKKLLVVYEKQGKTREAELLRLEKGDIQQMQ